MAGYESNTINNIVKITNEEQINISNEHNKTKLGKNINKKSRLPPGDVEDKTLLDNLVIGKSENKTEERNSLNMQTNIRKERQLINNKKVDSTRKKRNNTYKNHNLNKTCLSNEILLKGPNINESKESKGNGNCENYFGSLLLCRMNYNNQINQMDGEINTNKIVQPVVEEESQYSENPECKRRRIEIVAKQCRLHPSNAKYNKGPVLNPPPISPGILIGYTPAGQRHAVDLNKDRPTWFNSEYARKQYDDATKINVSRMMHELKSGKFVPSTLNSDVEIQYFKERASIIEESSRHFEKMKLKENIVDDERQKNEMESNTYDNTENLTSEVYKTVNIKFLETEQKLIEITEFAIVKINDFPHELNQKLLDLLKVQLKPLMFLKHPIVLDTLETLSKQRAQKIVSRSARALSDKIKLLFDVPQSQTFQQYFYSELKRLHEKTKDMSEFDIAVMTDESEIPAVNTNSSEDGNKQETVSLMGNGTTEEHGGPFEEFEDEWVKAEEGDNLQDIENHSNSNSSDTYDIYSSASIYPNERSFSAIEHDTGNTVFIEGNHERTNINESQNELLEE